VRVLPRAGRDSIVGFAGEVLRVRLAAPPLEGRANAALLRVLAHALDIPRSALSITAGAGSRDKLVRVEGLPAEEARARLQVAAERG
jgi:uncharacterized protein (TIGR00251 family)